MFKTTHKNEEDIALNEAVREFIEKEVNRLVVTQQGKPVGIISLSDFVAHIAETGPTKRDPRHTTIR